MIWLFILPFLWVPGSGLHTIPPWQGSAPGESRDEASRAGSWAQHPVRRWAGARSQAGETC